MQLDDIEHTWASLSIKRRYVFSFLTQPFSHMRRRAELDREFALEIANTYQYTQGENFYQGVSDLMREANYWMMTALCGRKDMGELLLEGVLANG